MFILIIHTINRVPVTVITSIDSSVTVLLLLLLLSRSALPSVLRGFTRYPLNLQIFEY